MVAVPFALAGGIWLVWLLGYHMSVATGVGFIALAGVAAEFGVVMLVYLKSALARRRPASRRNRRDAARCRPRRRAAARAAQGDDRRRDRRRPAAHLIGNGTGSEVMSRIAAPMIGGMLTAPLLSHARHSRRRGC